MKTMITDPMHETAMKSARGGVQQDLKPGFRLTPGSTIEAKVLEAAATGRLRIDVLGNAQAARLEAASPDQDITRLVGNLVGKTAVFRVLSVRPELVVAMEQAPLEEKGADPAQLRSTEFLKGGNERLSASSPGIRDGRQMRSTEIPKEGTERLVSASPSMRGGRQIQGRLVAMEGVLDPPSENSPGGYRSVLEVNGKNVSVWLDRPSTVGKNHLFKVIQTKPGPLLSRQGPIVDAPKTAPVQTVNYRNNSLLFAKVLQVGPGDPKSSPHLPARVEIGGQVVNVLLESPLQEGETLLFRVASSKGPPLLVPILGDEQNVGMLPASLKSFLNAQQAGPHIYGSVIRSLTELGVHVSPDSPESRSIQHVLKLVQTLTYGEEQAGRTDFLKRFLDLSGYTLEANAAGKRGGPADAAIPLQDNLKSLLIKLDGQLTEMFEQGRQGDARSDLQNLSLDAQGPVRNLLQHILATQVVNTVAFHEEGSLSFDVPFSWAGHVETGRLTVRFKYDDEGSDKQEKESVTEIMVVFLLDLENMGPLRVDAYLKKDDRISVTVMAERAEVAAYVRDRISELGESLVERGFKVEQISCLQVHRQRIQEETSPEVSHLIESDQMHIVA